MAKEGKLNKGSILEGNGRDAAEREVVTIAAVVNWSSIIWRKKNFSPTPE